MNVEIRYDCKDINWEEVASIKKIVNMGIAKPEVCEKAFEGSYATVFAFNGEELIGFARAISDGVSQAGIYDVCLRPECQGSGVGRLIIEELLKKVPGCNAILYANPGKEGFYEKMGFSLMKTGMAKFYNVDVAKEKGFIE